MLSVTTPVSRCTRGWRIRSPPDGTDLNADCDPDVVLGASGFLLKDTPPAELIDAVRQVASGRTALSQPVITQLITAVTGQPEPERRSDAVARLGLLTALN
jgi:hypothetical protein